MAPTICEDDMESCSYQNSNRVLRHRSVINYVGRNRENEATNVIVSSEKNIHNRRAREFTSSSSERRNIIKHFRRENRMSYESDDSLQSIPSPMSFHNYAKRRKYSESEDDSDNTSSETNENSVSSTLSCSKDLSRQSVRVHSSSYLMAPKPLTPLTPLTPFSPVSSTTGAMALYCRYAKSSPRHVNPFYRQDLMEIAMKTIVLLQKNRSLHAKLNQLKLETKRFVNSVMSNPENAKLRQTLNQSNEKPIDHQPKVLGIKNQ